MAHPLQHVWVLWEHKGNNPGEEWSNSMREVCEFSTIEEFWKYWCFVPKPSEVLFDGHTRKGKRLYGELFTNLCSMWMDSHSIMESLTTLLFNYFVQYKPIITSTLSASICLNLESYLILLLIHVWYFFWYFLEVEGRNVEAFSIFKKGIRPEWEDAVNRTGGELICRYD